MNPINKEGESPLTLAFKYKNNHALRFAIKVNQEADEKGSSFRFDMHGEYGKHYLTPLCIALRLRQHNMLFEL